MLAKDFSDKYYEIKSSSVSLLMVIISTILFSFFALKNCSMS